MLGGGLCESSLGLTQKESWVAQTPLSYIQPLFKNNHNVMNMREMIGHGSQLPDFDNAKKKPLSPNLYSQNCSDALKQICIQRRGGAFLPECGIQCACKQMRVTGMT